MPDLQIERLTAGLIGQLRCPFGLALSVLLIAACIPGPAQGAESRTTSPTPWPPSAPAPLPSSVQMPSPEPTPPGFARGDPLAMPVTLLVTDRENNRLLELDAAGHTLWQFPVPGASPLPIPFNRPDDAFYSNDGNFIATNAEFEHTVIVIDRRTGQVAWSYGHPFQAGVAPGYLNGPDDAILLPQGHVVVSDIHNCRVLELAPPGRIVRELGGICRHAPPTGLADPNGAFPLADGGLLVTEIGGSWIDRFDAGWRLVASFRVPNAAYPSDAQLLPDGSVLLADYVSPGAILRVDSSGHVRWRFGPDRGHYRLDHPSIAKMLPNGLVAIADDRNDRIMVVDPTTNQVVWEYGDPGRPGTAPGFLNTPDGLDFRATATRPGRKNAWPRGMTPN